MLSELIIASYIWLAPHMGVSMEQIQSMPPVKIVVKAQDWIASRATPGAIAFYDDRTDKETIYMSDKIDLTTNYGKSILLHELVHYIQFNLHTEYHYECDQRYERTAYVLQNKWLLERNEKPAMTEDKIKWLSFCFRHTDK